VFWPFASLDEMIKKLVGLWYKDGDQRERERERERELK
jgi:hypothetical protein